MCGKEHVGGHILVNTLLTEQNPTWSMIRNRMAIAQEARAEAAVRQFKHDLTNGKVFAGQVF